MDAEEFIAQFQEFPDDQAIRMFDDDGVEQPFRMAIKTADDDRPTVLEVRAHHRGSVPQFGQDDVCRRAGCPR
jgi:hypothetical protein